MDPSNNVDVSQDTMVDILDGITGIGAQNPTSETGTGALLLNLSGSTVTSLESSQVDQVTFQTGVQGGCTQESIVHLKRAFFPM